MNKNFLITAILVAFLSVMIYSFPVAQTTKDSSQIAFHSAVCIYKNGQLTGPCTHNTMMNASLNATRDCLGKAGACSAVAFDYIAVGNSSTAEDATLAALVGEVTFSGLARAEGTYGLIPQSIGNWSISKEFTVGAGATNLIVNTTALFNASSTGTMFAGKNFAASVTLQGGDKLNVTWYIWVS
jgi:hypothetical protein